MKIILFILLFISSSAFAQPRMFVNGWRNSSSIDADAQAYLTATGITDPTYTAALSTLYGDWKSQNNYNDVQAAYLLVNGSANACKINLVNPATFTATFSGGTFSYNTHGTKPNSGETANTHYNPSVSGTLNSMHISFYTYEAINETSTDMGYNAGGAAVDIELFQDVIYSEINKAYSNGYLSSAISGATNGWFYSERSSSTAVQIRKGAVQLTSGSLSSESLPNGDLKLWTSNSSNFSTKRALFASVGLKLHDPDAFYTSLNTFLTTIGSIP